MSHADVAQEALRWFIRARAPDFCPEEQRALDTWLTGDVVHQREFDRLKDTWRTLDGLAPHLPALRQPRPAAEIVAPPRWRGFLPWSGLGAALAVALLVFLIPVPVESLRYETTPGQHRSIALAPRMELVLDADSAVTIARSNPPRVQLLQGKAYFDIGDHASHGLEVSLGSVRIKDIGTRFAVVRRPEGGSVAVAEGLVEVHVGGGLHLVSPGQRVEFDQTRITGETAIAASDVAPWRLGQWRFAATPLAEVADEMARQTRIRLDIPDPKVAALTVSGNFDMQQPEQVLWAVAQVHGLKVEPIGERRFVMKRR
ncbi:MAG: FecR domain-containing protein [Rhodocyclaceae bacterium]|nr:FecR domain-containing protein [Rhodocyclaceae bacterium]